MGSYPRAPLPPAKAVLDTRALNRALLARHHLLERTRGSVRDVVHEVAGLQSQEPRDPFVALYSRIEGFRREHLLAALNDKSLVRATYLRGTLHTATAEDFLAFRTLFLPVFMRELTSRKKVAGGYDEAEATAIVKSLLGKGPTTLRALADAVVERFPKANAELVGHWARVMNPLVVVPSDDRYGHARPPRWVLAEKWLAKKPRAKPDLGSFLLRGIAAFGPCTAADLRTWSRLTAIGPALEALRPRLVTFEDERGRELFDLSEAPRPSRDVPAPIRFLAEYDNVFLSHDDRARILPPEHQKPVTEAANARRMSAILVDGFVRAAWSFTRERRTSILEIRPFEKLGKKVLSSIEEEGEAMLRCVEPDLDDLDVRRVGSHV